MKKLILLLSILITSVTFGQEYEEDTTSYSNINESNSFINESNSFINDTTLYDDYSDTSTINSTITKTEPLTEDNFYTPPSNTKTKKPNVIINAISNEVKVIGNQYKYQVTNQVRSNLTPNQQREFMVVQSIFRNIRR